MHGVYRLLLSLKGLFAGCSAEKKNMEEYICFWENTDLTAKQGGTSNQ